MLTDIELQNICKHIVKNVNRQLQNICKHIVTECEHIELLNV